MAHHGEGAADGSLGVTLSCTFSVLFICAVFSTPFPVTFTREELLNVRQSTPQTFLPVFTHPETFFFIYFGRRSSSSLWSLDEKQAREARWLNCESGVRNTASIITSGKCPLSAQQNG